MNHPRPTSVARSPWSAVRASPAGVDATLDTSGNQYMMVNAIRSLKFHGTFLPVAAAGCIDHFDVGGDIMMPMRTPEWFPVKSKKGKRPSLPFLPGASSR